MAGSFTIPATAVDLAPTVSAARAAGADCIGSGVSPAQSGPLLAAVNTGSPKLKIATAEGGAPPPLITALGKAANGLLATSGLLPPSSPEPAVQKLDQAMKAQYPKVPVDTFAQIGYASVYVIATAAKGLGDVTASSMLTALPKLTNYDTGFGPVVDFSTAPVAAYPRLFTVKDYVWVGQERRVRFGEPAPIDTTPALKLLGGK